MKPSSTDEPFERSGLGRREFLRVAAHAVAGAVIWRGARFNELEATPVASAALPVAIGWWRNSHLLLAAGKPALSRYDPRTGVSDRVRVPLAALGSFDPHVVPAASLTQGSTAFSKGARVGVHGVLAAATIARAGAASRVDVSGMATVSGTTTRFLAWTLQTKPGVNRSAPCSFRTPVGATGVRLAVDGTAFAHALKSTFALVPGTASGPKLHEGLYIIGFPGRDGVVPDLTTCRMRAVPNAPGTFRLMTGTSPAPFGAVLLSVSRVV